MKKNKKIIETGFTNAVEHEKGSVGEFIEVLKDFPSNAKITLNGTVGIDASNSGGVNDYFDKVLIHPQDSEISKTMKEINAEIKELGGDTEDLYCISGVPDDEDLSTAAEEAMKVNKESYADHVADKFCLGFDHCNPEMISTFRSGPADKLLGAPIMTPNTGALEYEENYLLPNQCALIDEIRHHNVYMAECMSELCRRGVAAMLEYNTQVLSHFARETTKDMCVIVDKGTAGEVLKCVNDEEF